MQPLQGTITKRMNCVLGDFFDEFRSVYVAGYCADDFWRVYRSLKRSGTSSARPSLQKELIDMFGVYHIPCERGKDNAYYKELIERSDLPEPEDMENKMLLFLYRNFREYPSPEDFIKRLVDKLTYDEDEQWRSDTLRLRILKQFIKYGGCLTYKAERLQSDGKIKNKTVNIYGGKGYIKKYLSGKANQKIKSLTDNLHLLEDDVFIVLENATKDQKQPDGTYGILKMADDIASAKFRSGGATKKSLYLFAMVYGMSFEDIDTDDALSSLPDIEKDLFRDYYTNNLMRYMHAFYRENYKAFENPSGRGVNYKNFAEVIYLYYLANDYTAEEKIKRSNEMILRVQEMQRSTGNRVSASVMGGTRRYYDLVKGQDERFFKLSEDELAEYICNNYNCSRQKTEKGKSASLIVGELQVEDEQETAYSVYKDIIEELLDTLAENECWSREEIKEYIKEMEEKPEFKGKRISQRDVSREYLLPTCNYGLWFTDISADFKSGLTGISDKIIAASEKTGIEVSTDNMVAFVETLKGMQRFMGKEVKEEEKKGTDRQEHTELKMAKTDALYVESSSGVTRTKLLTAFYYLFNARYADDFGEYGMSFREVFDMFSEEARPYLEDAYYPAIDPKNIFDVLLIFSSYSYLNMG